MNLLFPTRVVCLTLLCGLAVLAQPATLIVENARIYTLNPRQPQVSAIAMRGSRIVYTGGDVRAYVGPDTVRVDAKGATIVPGLIDSHAHMAGLGEMLTSLDLRHAKSVKSVADAVRQAAAGARPGEWIRGRAWDQTNWGGELPDHRALTEAAPANPIFLTRVDGHAAWVNAKALALGGVGKNTADPAGGRILRDDRGEATGVLIDNAQQIVRSRIPKRSGAETVQLIERATQECVRMGLTSVHDAGIGDDDLDAYRDLIARGALPVRIYGMIRGAGTLWDRYLKRGPETGDYLTVRSIKLVADGAMGSRGAALWQAYSDEPGNTGLLMLSKLQIQNIARDAIRAGMQVNTHAIGDRAVRTVLDAYAAALGGSIDKRFRIEHSQIVSLPDFKLFRDNGVIASIQSTHATSDMRWASSRLGPDRISGSWAARRFLENGIRIANGSDFPVENANPLWGFYAAITRQDHSGNPADGFLPRERLTREQALRSFTIDAAYAAFEESSKGSLEAGKVADFAMLSDDIMTVEPRAILKARVLMTVSGGRVVYRGK